MPSDADIAKDGIYGGIYYPRSDGEYTINILAAPQSDDEIVDRILESDQCNHSCIFDTVVWPTKNMN